MYVRATNLYYYYYYTVYMHALHQKLSRVLNFLELENVTFKCHFYCVIKYVYLYTVHSTDISSDMIAKI